MLPACCLLPCLRCAKVELKKVGKASRRKGEEPRHYYKCRPSHVLPWPNRRRNSIVLERKRVTNHSVSTGGFHSKITPPNHQASPSASVGHQADMRNPCRPTHGVCSRQRCGVPKGEAIHISFKVLFRGPASDAGRAAWMGEEDPCSRACDEHEPGKE